MKKSGRKLLGILLTASIIAATVFPMQGTAAEGIDREVTSETQKEEKTAAQGEIQETVSANILPAAETEGSLIMPASYDINQPVIESFELEENGKTLTKDDTLHFTMSAYDLDGDIRSAVVKIARQGSPSNTQSVTLKKGEGKLYTGTLPCSKFVGYEGNYYIYQIRLEDHADNYVEWETLKNGESIYTFSVDHSRKVTVSDFQIQKNASNADGNLRVGDTVTYTAHMECEDVNPGRNLWMYLKTLRNGSWYSESVQMSYDAETQTLSGTYTVKSSTNPSEWDLNYIYVYGQNTSYYFYPSKIEPEKDLKFTVVNDDYDKEKPVIESITLDKNGETVKAGETLTVKIKVNEQNPSSSMSIRFSPKASGISTWYCSLQLNKSTMEYIGTIPIKEDTYPTKWELTYLSVTDTNGNSTSLTDFCKDWNTTRPWHFTVDPEGYSVDKEAPVIESITLDKNGQWVYPGDKVTIRVKVNEQNPSSTAYAYFYPQVTYVSSAESVTLRYNADTQEYVGTISIYGNTYPCEWMLTDVSISDTSGHYTYLQDFKSDWRDTCPWYYRVETDDTYREDVKDAFFSVYGLVPQPYGGFTYGYLMENEVIKIGRRGSLKDIGVWPSLPAEGVNIKCQEGWSGKEIDGDTELFFGDEPNRSYSFYASYDKCCVNVVLTYVSRVEGIKTVIVPQFVDKEATYKDVVDSLALPEDADESLFKGYKLDAGYDETAQVQDTAYISVEAEYDNCLVAWNARYLDENGKEASQIVSKTYEKGTTINDALAAVEGLGAPDGTEFEKWALPGISGNETLSHPMISLDVIAVYKDKTTADISYTYRGKDGKLVSESKLMLLDGAGLSYADVRGMVPEILKEVSHFDGLELSGWQGVSGTDIPRYKKANVRAQYSNCMVILKYPNNVYEYAVVEKGAAFTLPVENDKYMDIVWEGYQKGETVTITGDKEFLAADVKLKDGTTEEPSGNKLSEEEIGKIVADIEQSGSGETIRVDMRKATIVPKEVLEAIQGKEVNIVLDMGTYSWSIGGNDVMATNLRDIDLEVIVDTDVIPPGIVDSLAEGNPATQISLIHDGEFGFRADLTVNLGSQHSGCTGNLYYYDSAGKLIFRDAGEIGPDGNISLSFSHASDYVVVIEKEAAEDNGSSEDEDDIDISGGSQGGVQNGGQDNGSQEIVSVAKAEGDAVPASSEKKDNDSGKPKSPKTGE